MTFAITMRVLVATCAALPGLHGDDRYVLQALTERGVTAEPAVWEDPYRDWSDAAGCLIRSVWDYAYRRDAFVAWAEQVSRATRLWNPAAIVRWNTHKGYLLDLERRGVATVPTTLLPAGEACDLSGRMAALGLTGAVLKAAVAQTGRYAMRVEPGTVARGQRHLDRLLPHEDMLLQPYVRSIAERGEVSLVFIAGDFTHAVRKSAVGGAFLVHDDYGGSVRAVRPTAVQLEAAERAVAAVGESLLYARVDLVSDERDRPMVMELELVEPELFFRYSQAAVDRLADAVLRAIG